MKSRMTGMLLIGVFILSVLHSAPTVFSQLVYYDVPGGQLKFDSATGTITGYTGNPAAVEIPDEIYGTKVAGIGSGAFANCFSLTSITIPEGITLIGSAAFRGCYYLTAVSIPRSVTSISASVFYDCRELTAITLPDSITSIGERAFGDCVRLETVNIPEGVTRIPDYAFSGCQALRSITIPKSVTHIGYMAFSACKALMAITIPESVTSIGDRAFNECSSLTAIVAEENNTQYTSIDGVLLDKAKRYLIRYPEGRRNKHYDIPYGVVSILECAFFQCKALESVTIPRSVVHFSTYAFKGAGLKSVTIPDSVATVGVSVFSSCQSLGGVTIPNSVTEIKDFAFEGCKSLTYVDLPESVRNIGYKAFSSCSGLSSVIIRNYEASIGLYAFFLSPVTIYSALESTAHRYAKNNNIPFVVRREEKYQPVYGISIPENATVPLGAATTLIPVFTPAHAANRAVKWSTSDPVVASVSGGTVAGLGVGQSLVTAVTVDGNYTAQCLVTVTQSTYTPEEDTLRKLALAQLSYAELDDFYGKRVSAVPNTYSIVKERMFKAGGKDVYWHEFIQKMAGQHKIITQYRGRGNGFSATVFEDAHGKIIIAYRGTEGIFNIDFIHGLSYTLLNLFSTQYESALNAYRAVKNDPRFQGRTIELTGHSLGGALAAYVSMIEGERVNALCFNDASGWILDNTYRNNAYTIKSFTGINTTGFYSHVNESRRTYPTLGDALVLLAGFNNFNEYTALYNIDKRRSGLYDSNTHTDNFGGSPVHGLAMLVSYRDDSFYLTPKVDVNEVENGAVFFDRQLLVFPRNLLLGTSRAERIVSGLSSAGDIIYTGSGDDTVVSTNFGDTIHIGGRGYKTVYGRGGSDTYIVNLADGATAAIYDSSGDDVIVLNDVDTIDTVSVIEDHEDYYDILVNGFLKLSVHKTRDKNQPPVRVRDQRNSELYEKRLETPKARMFSAASTDYMQKSLRLEGEVEVSVYDGQGDLLGIHSNAANEAAAEAYGYFYPGGGEDERYIDIDLINGDYMLKIKSAGAVSCSVYDADSPDIISYKREGIDLSDGSLLVIDSDFLNAQTKFGLEKNGVLLPVQMDAFMKATGIEIEGEKIEIKTGEAQAVTALVTPHNAMASDVAWEVIQPDETSVVAQVSTNARTGVTSVVGIAQGSAVLRAVTVDGSGLADEIPITVTRDGGPRLFCDTAPEGEWSDAPSMTVSAALPAGYDRIYMNDVECGSLTIDGEGVTLISAVAFNSATGAVTEATETEVKLDRVAPEVMGVGDGEAFSIDRLLTVWDESLSYVASNGVAWTREEMLFGKWHYEIGSYTITARDQSGKETIFHFEIQPLPAVHDLKADSVGAVTNLRLAFEDVKYDLDEERRFTLDEKISVLEKQWLLLAGQWGVGDIKIKNNAASVSITNRLGEYSESPLLVLAVYDEQGRLIRLKTHIIQDKLPGYFIGLDGITGSKTIKAFLLRDIQNPAPIAAYSVTPL